MSSREAGFRNKAKMVVTGSTEHPVLGILDADKRGIDLTGCPLYPAALSACFDPIASFITKTRLLPYDIPRRTGELKYVLLTLAEHSGSLMVRFVLRTDESVVRIRKHLATLQAELPQISVISVNLQPEHNAIVEGEEEIVLTDRSMLEVEINGRTFLVPPRAFLQTNPDVASRLYRQAQEWVESVAPRRVADLFCGIGIFGLHCAGTDRELLGVETVPEAVAGAQESARRQGATKARFERGDATVVRAADDPDTLVIVNHRPGRSEERSGPGAWIAEAAVG
ncbi:MAG: 23S rRNA (uracil(747)-C(5))-methyltransferase [Candidatus Eisenbacteria bacterium]